MTVTHLEKSEIERWETQDDGSEKLMQYVVYLPTYEYTVGGQTYQYCSRRCVSSRDMGRQVTGYYDPSDPRRITEDKPRKPILGGLLFFAGAAFLLFFAVEAFAGNLNIS